MEKDIGFFYSNYEEQEVWKNNIIIQDDESKLKGKKIFTIKDYWNEV